MEKRKYIIPEAPDEYEAYLYLWHLWIEELNRWHFYGGRKHARYHKVDYLHSSKDKQFKNDLARSKKVIFELLKYGAHEEMALEEGTLLKNAKNEEGVVVGAALSELWYNKTNGGGLYGKGSLSSADLNTMWGIVNPMLEHHQDIECGATINGITKKFIPEEQLENLIKLQQFLQTRDELFVASHVDTLCYKFTQDADPDNWEPLLILMDCEIVDNVPKYKKGSVAIISGNHRSRGNINCPAGMGLNGFHIPHIMWKGLKGVDFVTLSNRCNPDPEMPALEMSPESAATWMSKFAKEKGLEKTSDDGKSKLPDYDHVLISNELKDNNGMSTKKVNRAITIAWQRYENELVLQDSDNLIDFSEEGLRTNPELKKKYDSKVAEYTNTNEEHHYDWVYKISADIFKMGKVMEEIRRKKYKKNGLVLVHFKTMDQRSGKIYKGYKATFEEDLEHLISSDYNIMIKHLPLTTSECRAEDYID